MRGYRALHKSSEETKNEVKHRMKKMTMKQQKTRMEQWKEGHIARKESNNNDAEPEVVAQAVPFSE
jgi:hypothetical protein